MEKIDVEVPFQSSTSSKLEMGAEQAGKTNSFSEVEYYSTQASLLSLLSRPTPLPIEAALHHFVNLAQVLLSQQFQNYLFPFQTSTFPVFLTMKINHSTPLHCELYPTNWTFEDKTDC